MALSLLGLICYLILSVLLISYINEVGQVDREKGEDTIKLYKQEIKSERKLDPNSVMSKSITYNICFRNQS